MRLPLRSLLAALVALPLLAGCEDAVDPTLGLDAPFSLYGYLDPTADSQAVRVVPITETIEPEGATIDAAVTSTDLETGETTTWRDSLVTFADGSQGHVFYAAFTPRPGSRVRLEARRSDGETASAEVTVPPIVSAEVSPAIGSPGEVIYPVRFAGAPRVLSGQLRLVVLGLPTAPDGQAATLTVPLRVQPRQDASGNWVVDVPFLSATRRAIQDQGLSGARLRLVVADYVGFVADEDWVVPTDDPAALIEPGTFSNVDGGLGFVGSGYFATARWTPSAAAQAAAGFVVEQDPASFVALNEVSYGADSWVEFYNPLFDPVDLTGYSLSDDPLAPRKQALPFVSVPARGYRVVRLNFPLQPSSETGGPQVELGFYDRSSQQISRIVLPALAGETPSTYGSYPDGQSYRVPPALGGFDLFRGPLAPTPERPNELGIRVASVNEVFTEGASGWVETYVSDYDPTGLLLMTAPDAYFDAVGVLGSAGSRFGSAGEDPGRFDLGQGGGTLYLVATYLDPRLGQPPPVGKPPSPVPPTYSVRVVDARTFGGQTAGRSVGYLPDGPSGSWTQDLSPTRAAPNAAARLGL